MNGTRPDPVEAPARRATSDDSDAPGLVNEITNRLLAKFGYQLPAAVVEEGVRSAFGRLSTNARITTFLPVLTERAAEAGLLALLENQPSHEPPAIAHPAVLLWGELTGVTDGSPGYEFSVTSALPHVVVVSLGELSALELVRRAHPYASVLVWDRREVVTATEIAAGLDLGVDGYVVDPDLSVIRAHVRSVLRRRGVIPLGARD